MACLTLGELQRRYDAAYQAYQRHAIAIEQQISRGEWPSSSELLAEDEALHALSEARRELLAALAEQIRR